MIKRWHIETPAMPLIELIWFVPELLNLLWLTHFFSLRAEVIAMSTGNDKIVSFDPLTGEWKTLARLPRALARLPSERPISAVVMAGEDL